MTPQDAADITYECVKLLAIAWGIRMAIRAIR